MQHAESTGNDAPLRSGSHAKTLDRSELLPADVLLSRGTGRLADMIVAADRGSYSHAALWSGTGVVEATLDGIAERPLTRNSDVYRFVRDGEALAPTLRAGVVEIARSYCGARYAHGELWLLGLLFAIGRRPERPLLARALELLGGPEAVALARFVEHQFAARGLVPMVCSELVARSYYEVAVSGAYGLRVSSAREHAQPRIADRLPPTQEHAASAVFAANDGSESADWSRVEQRCRELLATPSVAVPTAVSASLPAGERKLLFGEVAVDAVTRRPVSAVTPGDLQFSTDLQRIGQVLAD